MNYTIDLIFELKQLICEAAKTTGIDIGVDEILLETPKSQEHGDYSCNIAMKLARSLKQPPIEIAESIATELLSSKVVMKVEVAGPGFINLFLGENVHQGVISNILKEATRFGISDSNKGKTIQVEFVSANPTGPLHVGHGRGAAYGASISNLLEASGYSVSREYYVNDAGRQMDILSLSTWLRYLEMCGCALPFPQKGYQGGYVTQMASLLKEQEGDLFSCDYDELRLLIPKTDDEEAVLDEWIEVAKNKLKENYQKIHAYVLNCQLTGCRKELCNFGVEYDKWFSEQSLFNDRKVEKAVNQLEAKGLLYTKSGAKWFKSTDFGDEKDRVVQRENGVYTYFASDIAYHIDKFDRGFDEIVNVWGADHHGYIPRVRGALAALGVCDLESEKLRVPLVQFAVLYRGKQKLAMSTRSGEFVTLEALRQDVGTDAARFFYVFRKNDQHLDFDLDLAKSQNNENPVYYIQYAHARCSSVLTKANCNPEDLIKADLKGLNDAAELNLMRTMMDYPAVIQSAARDLSPHLIAFYLKELAGVFHSYYNATQILKGDQQLLRGRLAIVAAVKQVIYNGLKIIGVNAPDRM